MPILASFESDANTKNFYAQLLGNFFSLKAKITRKTSKLVVVSAIVSGIRDLTVQKTTAKGESILWKNN